jgi:hypothetical protein
MGQTLRSDGFRLTISTSMLLSLVAGLVFVVRLDAKADKALLKFDAIALQVEALREDMKEDKRLINDHSVELREHRTMIHELQRKAVGKDW